MHTRQAGPPVPAPQAQVGQQLVRAHLKSRPPQWQAGPDVTYSRPQAASSAVLAADAGCCQRAFDIRVIDCVLALLGWGC